MALTLDESFDIAGDLLKSIAVKLREGDVVNQIDKAELYELLKQVIMDTVAEISD